MSMADAIVRLFRLRGGNQSAVELNTTATLNLSDTQLILEDPSDISKKARFDLSGIDPDTMRVITIPNADGALPINESVNARDHGAILDGASHPLSERFTTLALAQAVYPHATALTDEIDWAAIQAAFDVVKAAGGTLAIRGEAIINRELNFEDAGLGAVKGVIIDGGGDGSAFVFTGATDSLISLASSQRVLFRDINFRYTNPSFTGPLINCGWSAANSDPAYLRWQDCEFAGDGATGAAVFVLLDKAIICSLRNCVFQGADAAIQGGPSYSNVVSIKDCTFLSLNDHPILNPGESWTIETCAFEPRADGTSGAVNMTSFSSYARAFVFKGNWLGDVSTGAEHWIDNLFVLGADISGNYFAAAGTSGAKAVRLRDAQGVSITGNRFEGALGGVAAVAGHPCLGVSIISNDFADTALFSTSEISVFVSLGNNGTAPNYVSHNIGFPSINVDGEARADSVRIDTTPQAATPTPTHTFTVNLNGTVYRVPCVV